MRRSRRSRPRRSRCAGRGRGAVSAYAVQSPVNPAPTIATSTSRSPSSGGAGRELGERAVEPEAPLPIRLLSSTSGERIAAIAADGRRSLAGECSDRAGSVTAGSAQERRGGSSRITVVRPGAERTRLAGVVARRLVGERAPGSFGLLLADGQEDDVRAASSAGIVSVTRSTNGSSAGSAATASRSRSSSDGAPGKSDAVCPSGPRPSRTRSRISPRSAAS